MTSLIIPALIENASDSPGNLFKYNTGIVMSEQLFTSTPLASECPVHFVIAATDLSVMSFLPAALKIIATVPPAF